MTGVVDFYELVRREGVARFDHVVDLAAVLRAALRDVVAELGEPAPWALERLPGTGPSAILKWVTREGWDVHVEVWFVDHLRARTLTPGPFLEGPWASIAVYRQDGYVLSGDGSREGGHAFADLAYTVQRVRGRDSDWNWQPWYGLPEEEVDDDDAEV